VELIMGAWTGKTKWRTDVVVTLFKIIFIVPKQLNVWIRIAYHSRESIPGYE